jgi:hypothetical protein
MTSPTIRWCFVVEAHAAPDALLCVLNPFAVQGAELAEAMLTRSEDGVTIRLETEGLTPERAETLLRRLQGLAAVRRVGMGWRAAAQSAA